MVWWKTSTDSRRQESGNRGFRTKERPWRYDQDAPVILNEVKNLQTVRAKSAKNLIVLRMVS